MAFDVDGFRKAARLSGYPEDEINQVIAERTGAKGWWLGGSDNKTEQAVSAAGNFLNLPSYALGGMLGRFNDKGAEALNPLKNPFGIPAAVEGVQDKRAVMTELPTAVGVDPNSLPGIAIGFAGELATPDPTAIIGALSDSYKAYKGIDATKDATLAARGIQKAGAKADDYAQMFPLRGLGRNKTTDKFVRQLDRMGMSTDEFLDTYKLWGRNSEDASSALGDVNKAYQAAARQSGKNIDTVQVVQALDNEIAKLKPMALQSDSAAAQMKKLQAAKEGFLASIEEAGAVPLNTPLSKVADAKTFVSQDIPKSYFNAGAVQTGKGKGAETARRVYKNLVDTATGGETAKLGGAESALYTYRDLLKSKELAGKGNMNLSFTKAVIPGFGGVMGGIPGAIGGAVVQSAANSPQGIAAQSKLFSKIGSTLQNPKVVNAVDKVSRFLGRVVPTAFRVSQQPNGEKNEIPGSQSGNQPVVPARDSKSKVSTSLYSPNKKIKLFSRA